MAGTERVIIEEPIAAAIGAGIDITRPFGNMIVDIGGGTTDVAVISLGGTVVATSIKVAGDNFDEAIMRYVRKKHNLMIGERTAEDIKIQIGTVYSTPQAKTMEVKGRDTVTGLPKSVTLSSEEIKEALTDASAQGLWRRFTAFWRKHLLSWQQMWQREELYLLEAALF